MSIERDLCQWKETYVYRKRPTHVWKETQHTYIPNTHTYPTHIHTSRAGRGALQHTATHCNTLVPNERRVRLTAAHYNALKGIATQYNAQTPFERRAQRTASHCSTPQRTGLHCSTHTHTHVAHTHISHAEIFRAEGAAHCNATQRNTIQRTATNCNTPLHTATHCNTHTHLSSERSGALEQNTTHCNTLQHTATHTHLPREGSGTRSPRITNHWPLAQPCARPQSIQLYIWKTQNAYSIRDQSWQVELLQTDTEVPEWFPFARQDLRHAVAKWTYFFVCHTWS